VRRAAQGQELFLGGATIFPDQAKRRWLRDEYAHQSFNTHDSVVQHHYDRFDTARPDATFLDRMIYLELKHRLVELLLMRVDKMTMATSVEARVPYLDHELVRFALAIPSSLKIRNGTTKYVLKRAARRLVPDEVINRPKAGFCGSATNMITGALRDYAEQTIMGSDWLHSVLDVKQVSPMLAEHRTGRRDHGMAIWSLLNLVEWHRQWIE
jgi:asparagine synthase (glutamine-hydrolysing)